MTRFNINLKECVDMVYWLMKNSYGGEILIPKIRSYRLTDVAKAICPKCKIKYIGVRDGEKMHEELINKYDSMKCYDVGKYYLLSNFKSYMTKYKKKPMPSFSYNSKENKPYLSIFELKKLIQNQN
jgi:FlaA1/EpsC-like NDP-sugar epimerase